MAHSAKWLTVCELKKQMFPDYNVVSQPKDHKVIRIRWIFCIEQGPKGGTLKYNAYVIMQGLTQIKGGLNEPFVLAAKPSCLYTALAPAAEPSEVEVKANQCAFSTIMHSMLRTHHSFAYIAIAPGCHTNKPSVKATASLSTRKAFNSDALAQAFPKKESLP